MNAARFYRWCGLFGAFGAAGLMQLPAQEAKPSEVAKKEGALPCPYVSHIVLDQRTDPAKPMGKRNVTGQEHCLITQSELNPTLAIFSSTLPTAEASIGKLTKKANELRELYKAEDFNAFVLFTVLKDDFATDVNADKSAQAIRAWGEALKQPGVVLGLASRGPDDKPTEAAKGWNISTEGTTVVLFHRHKIIKRWDFANDAAVSDAAIAEIDAETTKEMKRK